VVAHANRLDLGDGFFHHFTEGPLKVGRQVSPGLTGIRPSLRRPIGQGRTTRWLLNPHSLYVYQGDHFGPCVPITRVRFSVNDGDSIYRYRDQTEKTRGQIAVLDVILHAILRGILRTSFTSSLAGARLTPPPGPHRTTFGSETRMANAVELPPHSAGLNQRHRPWRASEVARCDRPAGPGPAQIAIGFAVKELRLALYSLWVRVHRSFDDPEVWSKRDLDNRKLGRWWWQTGVAEEVEIAWLLIPTFVGHGPQTLPMPGPLPGGREQDFWRRAWMCLLLHLCN